MSLKKRILPRRSKRLLKDRERLQKYGEWLFYAAVILELAIYTLKKYDIVFAHQTWILRGITALLCCKILITKYTRHEYVLIGALSVLGIAAYFLSGRGIDVLFRASVLILASKGVSCKRVFLAVGASVMIVFAGWGIQSFLGMRPLYMIQQFGRGEDELRYCFGYSHPNTFHYAAWMLVTIGIYLWHDKMKGYHYALLSVFAIVITVLTRSRTGGILMLATILLFFVADRTEKAGKRQKLPYALSALLTVILMTGSSLPIIFGYKDNILRYANQLLNNRFEMARAAVRFDRVLQVSLFSDPSNEIQVDMGFVRVAYTYGWIPTILFAGCIFYLIFQAYRTQNRWNLVLITMTVCYTALEAVQVNSGILYNFVIIMMIGNWAQYRVLLPAGVENAEASMGGKHAGTDAEKLV